MTDDIVARLREGYGQGCKCFARCQCECGCDAIWAGRYTNEAADEIERLREWAVYEHAGHCGCAGGDNDCINNAYTTWKKVFGE